MHERLKIPSKTELIVEKLSLSLVLLKQQQEIDFVEEKDGNIYAYEFKWNKIKKKFPHNKTGVWGSIKSAACSTFSGDRQGQNLTMRTLPSKIFVFLLAIMLQSCVISINESGYRFLTEKDKLNFKPFSMEVLEKSYNHKDSIIVYEINSADIKEITNHHKFTWVVLWAPYCSLKDCKILPDLMCDKYIKYKSKDVQTILISNSYNIKEIRSVLSHSNSNCPIFVLQNSIYGEKQGRAFKKFAMELDNNSIFKDKKSADNFIFKDTLLIESVWDINAAKIDSIILRN